MTDIIGVVTPAHAEEGEKNMNIGQPKKIIECEPATEPVPQPMPLPQPVEAEPEKVPA
jgi:hypothetical protein